MRIRLILSLLAALVAVPTPMVLQRETGSIAGNIVDQWGPVANASVRARNLMSGLETRVKSDVIGRYTFKALERGRYSLWVEAPEHDSFLVSRVMVESGLTSQQDIFLRRNSGRESASMTAPD